MFTKAVAQAMKEARDKAPVEAPAVLRDLSGRRALFQQAIRFSIAVAIAASIATLLVMAIPSSQRPAGQESAVAFGCMADGKVVGDSGAAARRASRRRTATLAAQDGSGFANDPVPLGIHVGAPPPDGYVSISGLTSGARLTSGRRVGASEWRVPAAEISGVSVIPPEGFTGQMLVTAELRDGNGVALRRQLHAADLAGRARSGSAKSGHGSAEGRSAGPGRVPPVVAPPVVAAPPVAVATAPPVSVARRLRLRSPRPRPSIPCRRRRRSCAASIQGKSPRLIKRGQDLLASGDVQSARLLLLRGAEARDGGRRCSSARPTTRCGSGRSAPAVRWRIRRRPASGISAPRNGANPTPSAARRMASSR